MTTITQFLDKISLGGFGQGFFSPDQRGVVGNSDLCPVSAVGPVFRHCRHLQRGIPGKAG